MLGQKFAFDEIEETNLMFKNIVFLGAPGSGKGTAANIAMERYGFQSISTGNIFRYNIRNATPLGLKVKSVMDSGELVSDDLTNELVFDALKNIDSSKGVVFDGYPRTISQAYALDKIFYVDVAIRFNARDEAIISRLSSRRVCPECGTVYSSVRIPKVDGVCDNDGYELETRDDDRPETIKNRLAVYHRQAASLINHYKSKNKLFDIDTNSPNIDAQLAQFAKIIKATDRD